MKSNLIQFQGQSAGSYSDSAGIEVIRRHVADYIKERDGGIPSNWENIILCAGASEGIRVSGISPQLPSNRKDTYNICKLNSYIPMCHKF